jgi:four helix bundle protein
MGMSYRDLVVWQKAVALVTDTYRVTSKFPREEQFGLTSQVRRCSVSTPSNIAEGQGRLSEKEFRYFLGQARGSLMELETQFQNCTEPWILRTIRGRTASAVLR